MIKLIPKVVCDAGPIIHLDELNCLDLLADFQEIIVQAKSMSRHEGTGQLPYKNLTCHLQYAPRTFMLMNVSTPSAEFSRLMPAKLKH